MAPKTRPVTSQADFDQRLDRLILNTKEMEVHLNRQLTPEEREAELASIKGELKKLKRMLLPRSL